MALSIEYGGESFNGDAIISASLVKTQSLPIAALNVDTGDFSVEAENVIADQDELLTMTRNGSIINVGYISGTEDNGGGVTKLSVMSPLGKLTQMEHRGGVYNGTLAGDLIREICGDVPVQIDSVFENIQLYGWLPFLSPNGAGGAKVGSARDNLTQVLFAIGANLRSTSSGGLSIVNLSDQPSTLIDGDALWMDECSIEQQPPITAVSLLEHKYTIDQTATFLTLFDGTSVEGQLVVFSEPMSNLQAWSGGAEVQPSESGANYAVLPAGVTLLTGIPYTHTTVEITRIVTTEINKFVGIDYSVVAAPLPPPPAPQPAPTSISRRQAYCISVELGRNPVKWFFRADQSASVYFAELHASLRNGSWVGGELTLRTTGGSLIIYNVGTEPLSMVNRIPIGSPIVSATPVYELAPINTPNVVQIKDSTLVGVTNSADVANRLQEYYRHRETIKFTFDHTFETAGDIVSVNTPFEHRGQVQACISSIEITESAIPKATAEALIGFTPKQVVPFEDVVEVIDADTTWSAAEHPGVTKLTAYVFGGGQGGSKGNDGGLAERPTIIHESSTYDTSQGQAKLYVNQIGFNVDPPQPGIGGMSGTPGNGGNALRVDISLDGTEIFPVTIGVGGAGSDTDGVPGSLGTASTFGAYSSDSGSPLPIGYTIGGNTYGAPGGQGIPGNNGSGANGVPTPITVGSDSYSNGANGEEFDYEHSYGRSGAFESHSNVFYGGGAAAGSDGGNAPTNGFLDGGTSLREEISYPAKGGDATITPAPAVCACGGTGGHGGGGQGAYTNFQYIEYSYNSIDGVQREISLNYPADFGETGRGGAGGKGGDGIVVLIYRRPIVNND